MTEKAQRLAIINACRWERLGEFAIKLPDGREFHVDILNSLDAMHEAEKVLNSEQMVQFTDILNRQRDDYDNGEPKNPEVYARYRTWHATAAQRAEAFIDTLKLRDNSK